MKRILSLFLIIVMVFSLAACGQSGGTPASEPAADSSAEVQTAPQEPSGRTEGENILVAYFSWADNAVLADDVDAVTSPSVVPPGNVQQLAGWVQDETGGDLFAIRVTDPYPSDWDACLDRANEERGDDARPALAENVENLEEYDTVFLGYPNWWYGVPMALLTFFGGKRPFRQAGIPVLFARHGRAGTQCGDHHRGCAGCRNLGQYFRLL